MEEDEEKGAKSEGGAEENETPLRIDLNGITDRLVAFPVPEGALHKGARVEK